jgi:hypothetical protein
VELNCIERKGVPEMTFAVAAAPRSAAARWMVVDQAGFVLAYATSKAAAEAKAAAFAAHVSKA